MPYFAQFTQNNNPIFGFLDPYMATIQFVSAIISILLFTGIVILVIKLNYVSMKVKKYREILRGEGISKHRTVKIWKQICADLESGDPGRRKLAIIEADKVLDEILKLSGYKGETMSERLKQLTSAQIGNLDDIWMVHKIRNQIVHEAGYELPHAAAVRSIGIYEAAFRQLGLID
ncbi:MAG: hypothetical protein Q8L47_02260 [bacterium]|nr:hypothetical protein [bacterium]